MKSIFHALNRLKVFRGLTEQEFAWVLYDVGNSAFTMLSCSLIPIWFKSLAIGTAPGQINSHQATAYYSIAVAVVTVVVALLGPIFGVLADHKDKKKVLFTTAAALGIFGCILNGFITGWLLFLILYDSKLLYADQEKALELDSKVGSRGGAIDLRINKKGEPLAGVPL